MSFWSSYEARLRSSCGPDGETRRSSSLQHNQDSVRRKLGKSLSYKDVTINGEARKLSVIDVADDYSEKKIYALPGESLAHGGLVEWAGGVWLITEIDPHCELYEEGKMRRCNYYLKWINKEGNIIGRWCVVEDGTKYLIGEKRADMMTIGDARIAVTVGKDAETSKLYRGMRFLIDDMDAGETVLAYEITKPNKLFNVYNGRGVFRFILNEVNMTDDDNTELRIADYYSWKPKTPKEKSDVKTSDPFEKIAEGAREKAATEPERIEERQVWL